MSGTESHLTESSSSSGGRFVPRQANLIDRVGAAVVCVLVRSLDATLRYSWTVHASAESAIRSGPVIYATWHNRLALSLRLYERSCRLYRQSGRWATETPRLAAMVSASRDGAFMARVLEHFGVQPVRGSSSRRGPQALLELISWAERGYDLAITPDGPRGPRYVVQEGVVAVAQVTGMPIVPASYHVPWKYALPSWDRFQVPLPLSRCAPHFGELLWVRRDAGSAEREEARVILERRLRSMTIDTP